MKCLAINHLHRHRLKYHFVSQYHRHHHPQQLINNLLSKEKSEKTKALMSHLP
jgi:hypothetical protein